MDLSAIRECPGAWWKLTLPYSAPTGLLTHQPACPQGSNLTPRLTLRYLRSSDAHSSPVLAFMPWPLT